MKHKTVDLLLKKNPADWVGNLDYDDFKEWIKSLLFRLCEIETFIQEDVERLKMKEDECFSIIKDELKLFFHTHIPKQYPIHSTISDDIDYTHPDYTNHKNVYNQRNNLAILPKNNAKYRWILNSHIDVVPPHYPPIVDGDMMRGRGTIDNKGGIVVSLLVAKLLHLWDQYSSDHLSDELCLTISIDEEIGGNGSISLLRDIDFTGKSVVVLEPTKLIPHPSNRGALWFKIESSVSNAEEQFYQQRLIFKVIKALFEDCLFIRKEYPHTLYDKEDVQICFGILNQFGSFPATACTEFVMFLDQEHVSNPQTLEKDLNTFINNQPDIISYFPLSSEIKHIVIGIENSDQYHLKIHAKSGHMGSKDRGADAIVKSAYLLEYFENDLNIPVTLNLGENLTIEGGQGFLPSIDIDYVKKSIYKTIKSCAISTEKQLDKKVPVQVSFDKIHNEAYESRTDALGFKSIYHAISKINKTPVNQRITGWQASCDARIFSRESDDVTTFGAGALEYAHGPDEYVQIHDIFDAAKILFLAIHKAREVSCES